MISDKPVSNDPVKLWKISQVVYHDAIESLDSIFSSLNIKYMPIKGAYLICSGLSDLIRRRKMVDLDILVEKDRFYQIIGILEKHPFFTKSKEYPYWYFEQPFIFKRDNISIRVEIHYLLNRPERFYLPNEELFSRATKQTKVRYLPSPEDALLITVCHSMIHIAEGLPESFFEEIKVHLCRNDFLWNKFEELLYHAGIGPYGNFIFNLYRKKKDDSAVALERKCWWVEVFYSKCRAEKRATGTGRMLRRIFLELPFAKKPALLAISWLKRYKL